MRELRVLSCCVCLVLFAAGAAGQKSAGAHPAVKPVALSHTSETAVQLPVTRVALYKNGVGFFEHAGRVSGSESVTIDFTTAQLNDVLQSLTAIDLDGGRIAGAGYNSTTPLKQQLKALPLALGEDPNSIDFYNAIRGARVEVNSGKIAATGRLLKLEVVDSNGSQFRLITVIGEDGSVHTVSLTPMTSVRLLDTDLHRDVSRYLELLAGTRNAGLRHLTLRDNAPAGNGAARDLRVSYISEVPVWKSTYRILFTDDKKANTQPVTLQGWSVVDNTTGEDWKNVQLSLIAGAPQSFIQPLSQPIYSRRPEVAITESAQMTPQTHESGELRGRNNSGIQGRLTDASGAIVSQATVTATNLTTNVQTTATTDSQGRFAIGALPAGRYRVEFSMPGFQKLTVTGLVVNDGMATQLNERLEVGSVNETVSVTANAPVLETSSAALATTRAGISYDVAAAASIAPNSTTAAFDDYFAYNLTEPITIRKNESALVPILQTKLDAERVTLWSTTHSTPLRALWVTNTSNLTLDRGSFTIVENGNFGGEGLLDPIHAKEKRLLSYAVDQAVRINTEGEHKASKLMHVSAAKGVVILTSRQTEEVTYVVHNAAPDARTVLIEHPVQEGYVLDPGLTPAEKTDDLYRFRIAAPAGETARLHVLETYPGEARFELTDSDDDQIALIMKETGQNAAVMAALQPVIAAQRAEAEADAAVKKVEQRIEALRKDEERQRSNVTALASADKPSRDRFVRDLNTTEDKIGGAQRDLETAQAGQEIAKAELDKRIEAVQLDENF